MSKNFNPWTHNLVDCILCAGSGLIHQDKMSKQVTCPMCEGTGKRKVRRVADGGFWGR